MRLHRNEVFTVQFLIIVSMYRGYIHKTDFGNFTQNIPHTNRHH